MTNRTEDRLRWRTEPGAEAARANAATVEALNRMIRAGRRDEVLATLGAWPPAHALDAMVRLRGKRAQTLLEWLPEDQGLRLLSELDPRLQAVLLDESTKSRFLALMRSLDHTAALRLLRELPRPLADELLAQRPDAAALRDELAYDWDTAAAHMQHGSLALPQGWTIGEVIEDIRRRSDRIEKIDGLHVIDDDRRLTGYLRIRDLLLHPASARVGDVQRTDPLAVSAETDQEEVLALARARKASALAVVDGDGRLLGAITRRDLEEIAREEAEEDMLLMSGVSPDSRPRDTARQIVRRRLPWLVTGLIGSAVAATVIGTFEDTLAAAAILASFIPVVMATAGNAGMQAASVSLQMVATEGAEPADLMPRVAREAMGAVLNGALLGSTVAALVLLVSVFAPLERAPWLALTVAASILCVVFVASMVGTVMPFVLRALGRDPAAATGIFILGSNDVFGVLIYFSLATLLYF